MERLYSTIVQNSLIVPIDNDLTNELIRKGLHMLIACVPFMAQFNLTLTFAILSTGILIYAYAETRRLAGHEIWMISYVTRLSCRKRDEGRFVLGPVTLGIGALLSLMLYPAPTATIAIFALAFGDGVSSISGKVFGLIKVPFLGEKTFAGTVGCFIAVLIATSTVINEPTIILTIAVSAALIELLPLGDFDNIILPLGTGFIAHQLLII